MSEFVRNTSGFTADVELYDEKNVIKIYRENVSDEAVEREILCTESVQGVGLSVPKYGGRMIRDGKRAILLEYIEGDNMMNVLLAKQESLEQLAQDFARMHHSMHVCKTEQLEKGKVRLARLLRLSERNLGTYLTEQILGLLETLPEGNSICHNDFHPLNVIYSPHGMVTIDWSDATSGNPLADFARTVQMFDYGMNPQPDRMTQKQIDHSMLLHNVMGKFVRAYESEYAKLCGMTVAELSELALPWKIVVSASRFDIEWDSNKPGLFRLFYDYFTAHSIN